MCLILLSYNRHPQYRLVVAANRDEFYDRPTRACRFWKQHPELLAGKDLERGGTWLGMTRSGKFCALTNFRENISPAVSPNSRGYLVKNFLCTDISAGDYLADLQRRRREYAGFNLIAYDRTGLFWYSNRHADVLQLSPGWYGLSNHLLNTPWPKVEDGLQAFRKSLAGKGKTPVPVLLDLLSDTTLPHEARLPETGVGASLEKMLSPMFVVSPLYGTRSSTVVLVDHSGGVTLAEQSYGHRDENVEKEGYVEYDFTLME